jgi:hypothetical protein
MKTYSFWDITTSVDSQPTFQRKISPPFSRLKGKRSKKMAISRKQAEAFDPENRDNSFIRNIGGPLPNYSSSLKIEAIRCSESSVDSCQTTRRYIPEDNILLYTMKLAYR